ncbi:hypothetical protein AVEN_235253-1 [Araneus ventricosus]|uniref:Uncharacterized protein n=1 Tax=Araneus ventricosus TaxID=182803 RepID=A0A4Y2A323_ARAVE|nr:hypothetical protein AVEN_235253-1 [Araneus ventricosus]
MIAISVSCCAEDCRRQKGEKLEDTKFEKIAKFSVEAESPITSSPGIKFVALPSSYAKTEIFSGLPSLQLSSELNQPAPNYRTFPIFKKER